VDQFTIIARHMTKTPTTLLKVPDSLKTSLVHDIQTDTPVNSMLMEITLPRKMLVKVTIRVLLHKLVLLVIMLHPELVALRLSNTIRMVSLWTKMAKKLSRRKLTTILKIHLVLVVIVVLHLIQMIQITKQICLKIQTTNIMVMALLNQKIGGII